MNSFEFMESLTDINKGQYLVGPTSKTKHVLGNSFITCVQCNTEAGFSKALVGSGAGGLLKSFRCRISKLDI